MRKAPWILAALLLLASCGKEDAGENHPTSAGGGAGAPRTRANWPSAEARRLEATHAPTPYTAAQIRQGCADGRRATFRITTGAVPLVQIWSFDRGDAEGCTVSTTTVDKDGSARGEPQIRRYTWKSLQAHASWPKAETAVTDDTITVEAGTFDCMLYTVTKSRPPPSKGAEKDVQADRTTVSKYWFAWDLPGPPVRVEQRIGGKVSMVMEIIANEMARSR